MCANGSARRVARAFDEAMADLPSMTEKEIEVVVSGDMLTLKG